MHLCISALGIAFDRMPSRPALEARGLTFGRDGTRIGDIGHCWSGRSDNKDLCSKSPWQPDQDRSNPQQVPPHSSMCCRLKSMRDPADREHRTAVLEPSSDFVVKKARRRS
jgi:hypothetical protein